MSRDLAKAFLAPNGDGIGQMSRLLILAFEAGQIMNRLTWHLSQYAIRGFSSERIKWKEALNRLAGIALEISETAQSAQQLHDCVRQCGDHWERWFDSEQFSDDWQNASRIIKRGHPDLHGADLISYAFQNILPRIRISQVQLRRTFEDHLSRYPQVISFAFLLGDVVDQGVLPREAEKYFFVCEPNPEWYLFSRRHPDRRQLLDPLSTYPGKIIESGGPIRPDKFVHKRKPWQPGEICPPRAWAESVDALCRKVGTPVEDFRAQARWANQNGDPEIAVARRRFVVSRLVMLCTTFFENLSSPPRSDGSGECQGLDKPPTEKVAVDRRDPASETKPAPRSDGNAEGQGLDKSPTEILAEPMDRTDPASEIKPKVYLTSWAQILACLEMPNRKENRRRVRSANIKYSGPIVLPEQGEQPKVEKSRLMSWWNQLEAIWETEDGNQDASATVEETYKHGKDETVVPGISGHVKKRRTN